MIGILEEKEKMKHSPEFKIAYSVHEASEAVAISVPQVRLDIARGVLPVVRRGRRILILKESLERYARGE